MGINFAKKPLISGLTMSGLLAATSLIAPTILAGSAQAQAASNSQAEEVIVVTGSRIRRSPENSALPLQIFTPQDLSRDSISSPEQFIMNLSSNGTGLDNLASNADVVAGAARGNNGASSANLRGQGAAATLVLLNGRRVASHGMNGGAVDINQVPLAAIERIEVLKDGASAIYGTDAIGGVINFILKDDFQGLSLQSMSDVTEAGGGNVYRNSFVAGYGDPDVDGFNIMASVSYSQKDELRADQRDFIDTFQPERGVSPDTRGTPFATIFPFAGSIINAAGTAPFIPGTTIRASGGINPLALPGGAGCASISGQEAYDSALWSTPSARLACAWDTGRAAVLQQPQDTLNYIVRGVLNLGEHQLSAEYIGSDASASKRFSNVQLTPAASRRYEYPLNSITKPVYDRIFNQLTAAFPTDLTLAGRYGLPIAYRWRCVECGRREIDTDTTTGRFAIGLDGPLGDSGWDYRVGASQATSKSDSLLASGFYFTDALFAALRTGNINPFLLPGETQSQAGLTALAGASANGTILYGGRFTTTQYDGSFSGPLFTLPAGDVQLAIGFDRREEEFKFADGQNNQGTILAAPFDAPNNLGRPVGRNVTAMFAEMLVPITEDFEVTLATRRDNYTGFGATTNPKVSFRYHPIDMLTFRGSYNSGFRVPTFNQIFNGTSESFYSGLDIVDPAKCPSGIVSTTVTGCNAVQPNILGGGNVNLGPELADQQSLGFVLQPNADYSMTLDWWKIERTGTITTLSTRQMIDNYNLFPERFIRDSAGNLTFIDQRVINAGESLTEGVEVALRGRGDLGPGHWNFGLDGSYLINKRSRLTANAANFTNEIGVYTTGGDLGLRWKHNAYVTYGFADWSLSLSQLFRSTYTNQVLPGVISGAVTPPGVDPEVNPYTTYNFSATYRGFDHWLITGGIRNLLDTDPPFAITYDTNTGAGSNWEPRVADPRGRSFTLSVEYRF